MPCTQGKSLYGAAMPSGKKRDVIPSLMDVLSAAVERAGKDHVDLRPLTRDTNGNALSDKQIKRYLSGDSFPTGGKIDDWTRVVAEATGTKNRFSYWHSAIEQAEAAEKAGRASGAARKASQKSPEKSPRRQSPKGKTSQGG
jgi:hypothetical protein